MRHTHNRMGTQTTRSHGRLPADTLTHLPSYLHSYIPIRHPTKHAALCGHRKPTSVRLWSADRRIPSPPPVWAQTSLTRGSTSSPGPAPQSKRKRDGRSTRARAAIRQPKRDTKYDKAVQLSTYGNERTCQKGMSPMEDDSKHTVILDAHGV